MSETEEIAKAIQSVSRFGEQSLKTSEKLGGFFARVFQEPAFEVAGIITDRLRFVRWKRMVQISGEVDSILARRGIENTSAVSPKFALPLLEEASLEDEPGLQRLWNNLLANAMDPTHEEEPRTAYLTVIKEITAGDALILGRMYNAVQHDGLATPTEVTKFGFEKDDICESLGITDDEYLVSANNLMRLYCVAPFLLHVGASLPKGRKLTVNKETNVITMTPLGLRFVESCDDPTLAMADTQVCLAKYDTIQVDK